MRREIETLTARLGGAGAAPTRQVEENVNRVATELKLLQTVVEEIVDRQIATKGQAAPPSERSAGTSPVLAQDLDDAAILAAIREAIRRDRIDFALQPIVTLPQRKVKFYEAFTRIRTEDGRLLLPEQYIAMAECHGLIAAIDNLLLFRCVQLLRRSGDKRKEAAAYFCNISPHTLADRKFFRDFLEFMKESAELAPKLVFEIAQSTLAGRDPEIDRHLDRLARLGFRFSMDQVASLSFDMEALARRNVRFVKVPSKALLEVAQSAQNDVAMQDLKRMLGRHGIELIVEKLEGEAPLLEILDMHVDYGQGYLFGEPKINTGAEETESAPAAPAKAATPAKLAGPAKGAAKRA